VTYVQGALVSGASAHVLDRVLRSPSVRRVLGNLPPFLRAEVEATARAIHMPAEVYEALPVSSERSGETAICETAACWTPQEGVSTRQAAELLGVSRRSVQQLAAAGLGRWVAGRWQLDETAVREYGRSRRVG
jgi:hypothetical protein